MQRPGFLAAVAGLSFLFVGQAQAAGELNLYSSRHYDTDERLYREIASEIFGVIHRNRVGYLFSPEFEGAIGTVKLAFVPQSAGPRVARVLICHSALPSRSESHASAFGPRAEPIVKATRLALVFTRLSAWLLM